MPYLYCDHCGATLDSPEYRDPEALTGVLEEGGFECAACGAVTSSCDLSDATNALLLHLVVRVQELESRLSGDD